METEEGVGKPKGRFSWCKGDSEYCLFTSTSVRSPLLYALTPFCPLEQPQKMQKLALSVARVQMKKQKEREQKMLQENAILQRFGWYYHTSGTKKATERRRQEERVLKSTEGHFRNGVLDVKSLLKPSAPRANNESGRHVIGKGKKKKDGKKSQVKRKNGGRKRH
ncbi:Hypothetical predicted protein [Olea europaea subsp. europaea]|uniref:Uncharacterized protein n=1 Tax=Olea europaea subsp. europaea TaxID=158383 RepID=A0A8S0SMM5_OLEEU|nr:Hypothetical predicted protein [Olea europaea subsp. europaea]